MRDDLLKALSSTPKVVERLLRVFPKSHLDDRSEPDRFTPREVIAHLADWEQVILDRIRVANIRPGSPGPVEDPTQRALSHHYGDKDVFHEAEVFESRRGTTLEYLAMLNEVDWKKTFVHQELGEITIEAYMVNILEHDMYHLEQLSAYLANEVASIV
ncbi:MAG TPA: DinB family protein [Fimbriimonadaceae bacterium]|nr:DinB family protein [Fimbriimonadaceae bacterium]